MPVRYPKLYPKNWKEIALKVKAEANWQCQHCNKKCLFGDQSQLIKSDRSAWGKFTLTVHHIDGNPANNSDANLIALCAPCHLSAHRGGIRTNPDQLTLNL